MGGTSYTPSYTFPASNYSMLVSTFPITPSLYVRLWRLVDITPLQLPHVVVVCYKAGYIPVCLFYAGLAVQCIDLSDVSRPSRFRHSRRPQPFVISFCSILIPLLTYVTKINYFPTFIRQLTYVLLLHLSPYRYMLVTLLAINTRTSSFLCNGSVSFYKLVHDSRNYVRFFQVLRSSSYYVKERPWT